MFLAKVLVSRVPYLHQMYRHWLVAAVCILILSSQPGMAAESSRFGYLTVESVSLNLDHGTATYHVTYQVDDAMRFLFLFIGLRDLENRVISLINEPSGDVTYCDPDHADIVVRNGTSLYGEGMYYYPRHFFSAVIPNITVRTPQGTKIFRMNASVPEGIGYYQRT